MKLSSQFRYQKSKLFLQAVEVKNRILLAGLMATLLSTSAHAQTGTTGTNAPGQSWCSANGLNAPAYKGATDITTSQDLDECDLYFKSSDKLDTVFNFYLGYIVKEGFQVVRRKTKDNGTDLKANLTRGEGEKNNIELDVKIKDGKYKVEIEFDEP